MKQILVIFVLTMVFSCLGQAQTEKIETIYTDLTVEKCTTIESEEEGAGWYLGECPGVGGYKLELIEGDIRQTINVIAPNGKKSELQLWANVSSAFSAVGDKAEWRVKKQGNNINPLALIIRYNTNEDPEDSEKLTSRLVVIKIMSGAACITDIVEPLANANIKARELADASAGKACKFESTIETEKTGESVPAIEAYAGTIKDFIEKEGKPQLIIADVADYNNSETAVWKKYASEEEFEKARETEESYETAYIWKKGGDVVAVNMTYSSPSGDWAQYVYYVFRADGSVARAERELRTFMGDVIATRIYIYDENGKLLRETKSFRDLETEKPITEPESFMDMDVDIYKKTGDLPFASMILTTEPKGQASSDGVEEKFIPNGWRLEAKTTGDINGDSMADSVLQIIKNNAEDDEYDRSLIILFKTQDGNFTKVAEAGKVIRCSICGGVLGGGPANIKIEKGVLIISQIYGSREATDYLHRFRFEPERRKFVLIGEDVTNYDRATGESETISTNYLTGKRIVTKSKYEEATDKQSVVSKQTKDVSKIEKYIEDVNYMDY